MKVLSVNCGSSSLKFQAYEMPEEKVLIAGTFERIGIDGGFYTLKLNGEKIKKEVELPNHEVAVEILVQELLDNNIVTSLDEIKGIGHRVVHGGDKFSTSVMIDEEVVSELEEIIPLAPLHNPAAIKGIKAFQKMVPNAKAVVVFDTAFHQTMPKENYLYSVPMDWYINYGVRKYGFHGTSHKYVSMRMNEILGSTKTKLITCHIGSGGSVSAVLNGECIDTSMGFTPNAGIMMGTRSGDIDYSMIPYIMDKTGMTLKEVDNVLNKQSGLAGISGGKSDARDIEDGIAVNDEACILTQKMYIKRVVEYIAKYYVLLGGCDAIVFTAGLGENSSLARKQIMESLSVLGVKIDEEANNCRGVERKISSDNSSIACYIIPTDEELMIARDTYALAK